MDQGLVNAIVASGAAVLTLLGKEFFDRRNKKVTTDKVVMETTQSVISFLKAEKLTDEEKIKALVAKVQEGEEQHEECEQRSMTMKIALNLLEGKLRAHGIDVYDGERYIVDILDDDQDVRAVFRKKIEAVKNIQVREHGEIKELHDVLWPDPEKQTVVARPHYMILDYRIHGQTIDDLIFEIIRTPEFNPEIIIITGMDKDYFKTYKYREIIMEIVNKQEPQYINRTVNMVLSHIEQRTKR